MSARVLALLSLGWLLGGCEEIQMPNPACAEAYVPLHMQGRCPALESPVCVQCNNEFVLGEECTPQTPVCVCRSVMCRPLFETAPDAG